MNVVDFREVVRAARPAVVHIGQAGISASNGELVGGSGFVVAPGIVVTSQHVLRTLDGRPVVTTLFDEQLQASVIRDEPCIDLALLSVPDTSWSPAMALRDPGDLHVGEPVIAMGSAFGIEAAVTSGILSSVDLHHVFQHDGDEHETRLENLLVTDALIGQGNSGGPLLGADGLTLGVTTGIKRDGGQDPSGLGFAIPARTLAMFLDDVTQHGRWRRGTLRLHTEIRPLHPREREAAGGHRHGLVVWAILDPAPTRDRVRPGDVLLAIDGAALDSPGAVTALLNAGGAPNPCVLTVLRRERTLLVEVVPCEISAGAPP